MIIDLKCTISTYNHSNLLYQLYCYDDTRSKFNYYDYYNLIVMPSWISTQIPIKPILDTSRGPVWLYHKTLHINITMNFSRRAWPFFLLIINSFTRTQSILLLYLFYDRTRTKNVYIDIISLQFTHNF